MCVFVCVGVCCLLVFFFSVSLRPFEDVHAFAVSVLTHCKYIVAVCYPALNSSDCVFKHAEKTIFPITEKM